MPAPFPPARPNGRDLEDAPSGFSAYFSRRQPRIVTADVWEFLFHTIEESLDGARRREADAYVAQAFDFFETAVASRVTGAKPLLYYYSFLNLAKAALVLRGLRLPVPVVHGIKESRRNIQRRRLRFEGQFIRMDAVAPNNSRIFPEFVRLFGGAVSSPREYNVRDLLGQIPSIHRTFTRVTGHRAAFVPIKRTRVLHDGNYVWVRFLVDSLDKDVRETLPLVRRRRAFRRRSSGRPPDQRP